MEIIFVVIYVFFMLFALAIAGVFYALTAIALKKLSENRGYEKGWLAWIPIANNYLLGSIADSIEAYNGKNKSYRKIMLWLSIAPAASGVLMFLTVILGVVLGNSSSPESSFIIVPIMVILYMALLAGTIALAIFGYIVLYKIYKDYAPDNAVIYLVLSIFVNVTAPFLLFSIRDKASVSMKNGYHVQ